MGSYSVITCCRCDTPIRADGFADGKGPEITNHSYVNFSANCQKSMYSPGRNSIDEENWFEIHRPYQYSYCTHCASEFKLLCEAVVDFMDKKVARSIQSNDLVELSAPVPKKIAAPPSPRRAIARR